MDRRKILRKSAEVARKNAEDSMVWWELPLDRQSAQEMLDNLDDSDSEIWARITPDFSEGSDENYTYADLAYDLELDKATAYVSRRFDEIFPEALEAYRQAYASTCVLFLWAHCRSVIDSR